MQRIWRSILRPRSLPRVLPAAFETSRRHPSSFAGRDPVPLKPAALALPDELDQLSRSDYEPWHMEHYIGVRSEEKQGSLIEMTSLKRGIVLLSDVLFEFDMRIKTGENEEDDIQLIDGLIHYDDHIKFDTPFTSRISGNCGAVDMCFTAIDWGVEAVIEVTISEVQSDFDLSLSSIVCLEDVLKEVQLFYGAAREMGIKRSVVAVPLDTTMHLKLKIGQKGSDVDAVHHCSFDARLHGCTNRQIKLVMACISLKVTWRPPLF
ncbi:hypothetical protein PR202_gb25115 [Eleusine coracana subsp. coracana]|uniref:DUF6598 domain-containing protein n=1 Tax=Eleusine coracana subsp. coracana TaxID=191504 RepID=A0AAV5FPS3_ELECO|nr:hypothetical protein PR202_gb25115 [Eleusine coracana subsp. coracana]